jgi:hypothetical protein
MLQLNGLLINGQALTIQQIADVAEGREHVSALNARAV